MIIKVLVFPVKVAVKILPVTVTGELLTVIVESSKSLLSAVPEIFISTA